MVDDPAGHILTVITLRSAIDIAMSGKLILVYGPNAKARSSGIF
jgi:hypothetical protein